ncbi:hypothetical protein, partial [Actinomadura kijaniata]|uniref:hypothetical protein n=1 Tax=Actinomadura kijaniata TaxID=46161 RepID=UPI001C3F49D0
MRPALVLALSFAGGVVLLPMSATTAHTDPDVCVEVAGVVSVVISDSGDCICVASPAPSPTPTPTPTP